MEKQPQADSAPVTKSADDKKLLDGGVQSTDSKELKSYQEIKTNAKEDESIVENNSHIDRKEPVADKSLVSEEKPSSHLIISVDIQKNMPCDAKETVPQDTKQNNKQPTGVPPEILASVVTNAVVQEAALTVSEKSVNFTQDSSKVDAAVEQELNNMSNTKSLIISKPMLNGDIDHSPVQDGLKDGPAKSDATSKQESVVSLKEELLECEKNPNKDSSQSKQSDCKTEKKIEQIEVGTCNGVPGIITVESITKKEAISSSLEAEKSDSGRFEDKKLDDDSNNSGKISVEKKKVIEIAPVKTEEKSNLSKSNDKSSDNLTDSAKLRKEIVETLSGNDPKTSEKELPHVKTDEGKNISGDAKCEEEKSTHTQKSSEKEISSPKRESGDTVSSKKQESAETTLKTKQDTPRTEKTDENEPEFSICNVVDSSSGKRKESDQQMEIHRIGKESLAKTEVASEQIGQEKAGEEKSPAHADKREKEEKNKTADKMQRAAKEELPTEEICDMTAMMTSQILTPADLGMEDSTESPKDKDDRRNVDSKDSSSKEILISATVTNGKTCNVAVGLDERKMARVAAPSGEDEEVDGQQASAEVEVSEDATVPNEGDNLIPNGTTANGVPSSPNSIKSSSPTTSASKQKEEEVKPTSAVSRSSIPEAIVYEPPERRKSAASLTSENKKDPEADKCQFDEKESEKNKGSDSPQKSDKTESSEKDDNKLKEKNVENITSVEKESSSGIATPGRATPSSKESASETGGVSEKMNEEESVEDKKCAPEAESVSQKEVEKETDNKAGKKGAAEENTTASEKETSVEKGVADEKEMAVEKVDESSVVEEEEKHGEELKDNISEYSKPENDTSDKEKGEEDAIQKETVDENIKKFNDSETVDVETKAADNEKKISTSESEKISSKDVEIDSNADNSTTNKSIEKEEPGTKASADEDKVKDESSEISKESMCIELSAVEEKTDAERENNGVVGMEADTEKVSASIEEESAEIEEKGEAEEKEEKDQTSDEPKTLIEESKTKAISAKETAKSEEKEEDDTEKEISPDEEVRKEENKEEDEKSEEVDEGEGKEAERKAEEPTKGGERTEEDEQAEEQEKQDVGKEEKPQSPKSATKRSGSPTKVGRRGISPLSSPPKALKTPSSPQKPPKTTSPKKKNGMLSPIKTPKTPGSDGRKLPPIKAPVGLAPNPNLKNIRSKIGSFDNIRYKPGGGDKKVITKKLEWKAAPKIGSLDHSHKKHGKGSKGESKEGKVVDGQSPLPSGDEGDVEGSAAAETLIKPDGTSSLPSAITAES